MSGMSLVPMRKSFRDMTCDEFVTSFASSFVGLCLHFCNNLAVSDLLPS